MRFHPSQLFIRSLVFRDKNSHQISTILEQYGLPGIPDEFSVTYLKGVQDTLGKTIKDFDCNSSEYREFIKEHKIHYLLHPDSVLSSCTRLLDTHQIKNDLYISLLGKISNDDVVDFLNRTYNIDITVRMLQVFKHYYFDIDLLNSSDWVHILPVIPGTDEGSLSSSLQGGASAAAYRLGLEQNITIRDAVQEAVVAIHATLKEIRAWPASPQKVKVLSDAVGALHKAHGVINTADQELASVAKELRQFKLEKTAAKTVPLKSLTKGRHSGSKEYAISS